MDIDTPVGPSGLRTVTEYWSHGYESGAEEVLHREASTVRADHICSRIDNGTAEQLLLVDIDMPCRLLVDTAGTTWLHVDHQLSARQAARLLRRLHKAGVAALAPRPEGVLYDARRAAVVADTLIEMGADCELPYQQLFELAWAAAADVTEAGAQTPTPTGGLWVPLVNEHLLVASRTTGHFHLIGTRPLARGELLKALRALRRAGVVERAWLHLVRQRGFATLTKPQVYLDPKNPLL